MIKRVKVAKLRFRADDGSEFPEWSKDIVGHICLISTGKSNTQDKRDNGKYDFYVRSSKVEKSDKYLYDEEAVLTAGDGVGTGKVFHYVNGKYDLHQRVYRMYNFHQIIGKYFYYYFSQFFYRRVKAMSAKGSVDSVRLEMIYDMPIYLPSLPEQKKIASFLSTIDDIITTTEAELNAWQERKKGVMQKIFNREVRFKADDGSEFPEWEEKRLGDVFVERSERSADNLDLLSVTIANGVIRQNESDKRNVSSVDKSNYKRVYIGDLAYNSMRMWQGAEGVSAYDGIVSPAYTVLVPKKQEYVYFYEYMFKRTEMLHIFQRYSQGLTSDTWNLKYPALSHISVVVPSLLEQKKIAECLSSVDGVIRNIQAELSAWKEFKKGLLQQMFV